jgi:hypothetical protein
MYCGHCGAELPGDVRFCPSCGKSTHQTVGRASGPVAKTEDKQVFDDIKRLLDEAARYRELARSGPVNDQLIRDGDAFHLTAPRQCDALMSSARFGRDSATIRSGVELPEYHNATVLISMGRRLSARDPAVKNLLKEVFPIYAEKGVDFFAEELVRRFRGELSPDFAEELRWARALREYLDSLMFTILLEGLARNKLLPVQERLFSIIMVRVGIDATKRAMENAKRIRG